MIALPAQTGRVLSRLERGDLTINMPQVNRQIYHLESAVNRMVGGLVFASFLFGGVLLYRGGDITLGYIFWGFSTLALLWTVFLAHGHTPWHS